MENNLTKSQRKFIRTQKADIRSRFLDVKKQEELISEIYKKFVRQPVGVKENKKDEEVKVEIKKPEIKKESKKRQAKVKVK